MSINTTIFLYKLAFLYNAYEKTYSPIPLTTSSPCNNKSFNYSQQKKSRPIRLLNMNAQSIKNKRAEFCNLVESTQPDVIVCTETWLNSDIANGEIFSQDIAKKFNVFRRDREHTKGGGVFIAVSSDLVCSREYKLETDCEILWVKICIAGCKSLHICAYYNPHEENELSLANFVKSVQLVHNLSSHIWIAGDMNFPGYDWLNNCLKPNCSYPSLTTRLVDLIDDCGFTQMVTAPTRGANTLDLFITNNDSLINTVKYIPGLSDHDIVYVEGDINPIVNKQKPRKIFLYNKADWVGLRKHINDFSESFVSTNLLHPGKSVNQLWDSFKLELEKSINKYIPFKSAKRRNGLPYMTTEIKRLMKKRDKLHPKKDPTYKKLKHLVQKKLRAEYWLYIEDVITPLDNTDKYKASKRFWSFVKHSKSDITGMPPLETQWPNGDRCCRQSKTVK